MKKSKKVTQTKAPKAIAAVEPDIVSGFLKEIDNEALASLVIDGVETSRITAKTITELRKRFTKLSGKATIHGYRKGQWTKFCDERLGMSPRNASRWVKKTIEATGEPHPGAKHDGSKKRQCTAPWFATTPDGTTVDVARSAAQKAVRDGDEQAGVYWIKQLYDAGKDVWKALSIFAVEEIAIADLTVKTHVLELEQLAAKCVDKTGKHHPDLLHVVTAMLICCRAKKSRTACDSILWYKENPTWTPPTPEEVEHLATAKLPKPIIPDKVFDKHTAKGRNKGRGLKHFLEEAAVLKNVSDVVPFTPPTTTPCPHCGGTGKVPA